MTTGATPSQSLHALDPVDGAPNVKSNYVDCATNVTLQRKRQPLPTPATPPLADPAVAP
ncbi:hypothetical protein HPC49_51790 [Pyxidicoccus fallax]|uniref:Uncharacterized protein n=1 Tax=Pyxidicoccus fallax TaxID=394095 RepID=A0A848LE57_9BACT|nr:hypothetical protein [Pyxidicoccus fallax]NMO17370.1 hypothetical protein [Pyxidicoccus fallax]NPC86656.1 hypothetical protein [Pyxidicoccus fallax]